MRLEHGFALAAVLAVACALPKVELDPALTPSSGGSGGAGGAGGGSGGSGSPGKGGTGPLGGDAGAGDADAREADCGDYCTTYQTNCRDSPANTYDDLGDCLNTCFNSDWPLSRSDSTRVNSISCRIVHANLAETAPDPHCFHSAEVPTGKFCAPQPP